MTKLCEQSLHSFNQMVSSDQPVPGGGSVAALAGSLAASLGQMVLNLTIPKKMFDKLEIQQQENLLQSLAQLKTLQPGLIDLIDEDTAAYDSFMQALRLPKETEAEIACRADAMQHASVQAMEVPLRTAQTALSVLRALPPIARYGNRNAVSDVGVAGLLAYASAEGAVLNVLINLPGIPAGRHEAIRLQTEELLSEGAQLRETVMAAVYERLS